VLSLGCSFCELEARAVQPPTYSFREIEDRGVLAIFTDAELLEFFADPEERLFDVFFVGFRVVPELAHRAGMALDQIAASTVREDFDLCRATPLALAGRSQH
jgi:hypothetical protein